MHNQPSTMQSRCGRKPGGGFLAMLILGIVIATLVSAESKIALAKKAVTVRKAKAETTEISRESCAMKCQSQVRGNPLLGGASPNLDWVVLGAALFIFYAIGYGIFVLRVRGGGFPLPCLIFSLALTAILVTMVLPFIFGYRGVAMVELEAGAACWCDRGVALTFGDHASQFAQFNWPVWIALMGGTLVVGILLMFGFGRRPQRSFNDETADNEQTGS
jgi:hypothetical protein